MMKRKIICKAEKTRQERRKSIAEVVCVFFRRFFVQIQGSDRFYIYLSIGFVWFWDLQWHVRLQVGIFFFGLMRAALTVDRPRRIKSSSSAFPYVQKIRSKQSDYLTTQCRTTVWKVSEILKKRLKMRRLFALRTSV